GPGEADERIAEALDTSAATVARVRKKFVQQGPEAAVQRKRPSGRLYRKLDGAQEARLAALACSPPPDGQARWTMKLLADKLVEMEVVESIDPATVCRALKKTRSSRGGSRNGSGRARPTPASWRRGRQGRTCTPTPTTPAGRTAAS